MRDTCIDAFNDGKILNMQNNNEEEIISLKKDLAKFVQGEENLNIMLGAQRSSLDKQGIGYNLVKNITSTTNKIRVINNKPRNKPLYCSPFVTCKNCGLKGHFDTNCNKIKIKQVWVKKRDLIATNNTGPKQIWVPKR